MKPWTNQIVAAGAGRRGLLPTALVPILWARGDPLGDATMREAGLYVGHATAPTSTRAVNPESRPPSGAAYDEADPLATTWTVRGRADGQRFRIEVSAEDVTRFHRLRL